MRFNISTISVLLIGTFSLIMLVYYYTVEKDFRQNYKTINAHFNSLQKDQERISYGILQSALYAYYNQDAIAKDRHNINNTVIALQQYPLLKKKHYQPLYKSIENLQIEIKTYVDLIEDYLMFNAGIKNSSVFLSTHGGKVNDIFPAGSAAIKTSHDIIDSIVQAKRTLDDSHLKQLSGYIKSLEKGSYQDEQTVFIKTLLIHAKFIEDKYPLYIDTFHTIMNSPLRANLEKAKQQFITLAKADITYLNTLAVSLFILIVLALVTISGLLFYMQKENIKLVRLHNRLQYTMQHDTLTGLLNRHSYEASISQLKHPAILLININGFKLINDFYGTDNGDKILIEVATELAQKFKDEQGICYRIGGDEFAVLFKERDIGYIEAIAHELDDLLTGTTYRIADLDHKISINMAISDQLPLLETADMALKQLKSKPTGNLLHYSIELNVKEQIQSNIEMTQILHDAINENRIIPYYQPIIDLQSREIVKYEALVRLKLNNDTILSPAQFLPVAQRTPLYREITRVMITKTIAYFADKPYRFSINFSMTDLEDDEIISTLLGQLTAYPDIVTRLDIELLESEMLSDMDKVKNFISDLKKLGCGISIDDFGSGYSNFTALTELDLDVIKIDGSLVKEIKHSTEHYKTVKAIMGLVNELGIESIAEYVQDETSAQLLTEMGVTYAQGNFFGKPDAQIVVNRY